MRMLIVSLSMTAAAAEAEAAAEGCVGYHHGIPRRLSGLYSEADLPKVHDPQPPVVDLSDHKRQLCVEIDEQTAARIVDGDGFEYSVGGAPYRFSLSDRAQMKWIGLYAGRDLIDYGADPPQVPTKDDGFVYVVPDAATVSLMYATALATVKSLLDSGLNAKVAVMAADDLVSVDTAAARYLAS